MNKENGVLDRAMQLCSRQEYCCLDVKNKLLTWGLDAEKADEIINQLVKEDFINENRYAISFTKDKLKFDKWGRVKIVYMLRQKKVNENSIQDAINEIDEVDYHEILSKELKKKFMNMKTENEYEIKGKLLRFAQSRGFETELVVKIVNEINKSTN